MFNVLIADNDVDAWFQINAVLRRHLIKASFVNNLNAAKDYIEHHTPSLLFFDKQLHDTSVKDFIWYVRSKYPKAKIILINTCNGGLNGLKSAADFVISKPLIPDAIERAIVKLLKASEQDPQPAYSN